MTDPEALSLMDSALGQLEDDLARYREDPSPRAHGRLHESALIVGTVALGVADLDRLTSTEGMTPSEAQKRRGVTVG